MLELTIAQACEQPQSFMYVWCPDELLAYMGGRARTVIATKRANQNKLLQLSADKFKTTKQAYTDAIRQAFINAYGMTPAVALEKLAMGEEVAGKNWAAGVYGIGATDKPTEFAGTGVTVDPTTGHIMAAGENVSDSALTVYGKGKNKTIAKSYSATGNDGKIYTSMYDKRTGTYYAYQVGDAEGAKTAKGLKLSAADSADIWASVLGFLENITQWLINLFGGGKETLSAANTLPSQSDGFVAGEDASVSTWLLILLGGGLLLSGGLKGGKKKKK